VSSDTAKAALSCLLRVVVRKWDARIPLLTFPFLPGRFAKATKGFHLVGEYVINKHQPD
jgi:hypothetical protein